MAKHKEVKNEVVVSEPAVKDEPTIALDMPLPFTHVFNVKDLPDPREHPRMNLRGIGTTDPTKTLKENVEIAWGIPALADSIEKGAPNSVPAIYIARWRSKPDLIDRETGEALETFPIVMEKGGKNNHTFHIAINDGNIRLSAVKKLFEKYPDGHDMLVRAEQPDGTFIERKVRKTYDHITAQVYDGMTAEQYHHLQLISGNRRQFKPGDIYRKAIFFIRKNPTMKGLAEACIQYVGSQNIAICTKAKDQRTGFFQTAQRAACMTRDVAERFVAWQNADKVDGNRVLNPNEMDLRVLITPFKLEVMSFEGNEVTPGVFWDRRFELARDTVVDIEAVWKQWTPEQCTKAAAACTKRAEEMAKKEAITKQEARETALGGSETKAAALVLTADEYGRQASWLKMQAAKLAEGKTPDKLSEFLARHKNLGKKVASDKSGKAATAAELQGMKGELFSAKCPATSVLIDTLRGAPKAPSQKVALDLAIRFERRAWELLDEYAPEEAAAFRDELDKVDVTE